MKICLVSEEFQGVTGGGGIGACFLGLASFLSSEKFQVEVLITKGDITPAMRNVAELFNNAYNISFLADFMDDEILTKNKHDHISKSYLIYRYLNKNHFDVVHFHEYLGLGHYTVMARSQGLFDKTIIVTQVHGSTKWVRTYNSGLIEVGNLEIESMEIKQIELSDIVVSPSKYMLDWYVSQGVTIKDARVINWILPAWLKTKIQVPLSTKEVHANHINHLIFFGRHERRKGFVNFVDAAHEIMNKYDFDLTFLGRFDKQNNENSVAYAINKLRNFPGKIAFIGDYDQNKSHKFIAKHKNALCVMPSLIENSPCVVGEMLTMGLPFISGNVGGTHELLEIESQAVALVDPSPHLLASHMAQIIEAGMPSIKSILNPVEIKNNWLNFHKSLVDRDFALNKTENSSPLVSVIVTHFERPLLLERALNNLICQSYKNIEIIVVDDGSRTSVIGDELNRIEAHFCKWNVKFFRTNNNYLGAARNFGTSVAKGDYFLFHDDDNVAEPFEVETFVKAAISSDCEILTSQYLVFHDINNPASAKVEYYPIGIGGDFSFFRNRFGDANALISRRAFKEVGGFTELKGIGFEDWEFFIKAYIYNIKMGIVPIPLFRYYASASGMLATGSPRLDNERIIQVANVLNVRLSGDMLLLMRSKELDQQVLDKTWHAYAKNPECDLLRQLMAFEANSDEAYVLLSKLAFNCGRIDDAVALAMWRGASRRELSILITAAAQQSVRPTRSFVRVVIPEFKEGLKRTFIRIVGWAASTKGEHVKISGANFQSNWIYPISTLEISRPDVLDKMSLNNNASLGFEILLASKHDCVAPHLSNLIEFHKENDCIPDNFMLYKQNSDNLLGCWIDNFEYYTGRTVDIYDIPEEIESFILEIHLDNISMLRFVLWRNTVLAVNCLQPGVFEVDIINVDHGGVVVLELIGVNISKIREVKILSIK